MPCAEVSLYYTMPNDLTFTANEKKSILAKFFCDGTVFNYSGDSARV